MKIALLIVTVSLLWFALAQPDLRFNPKVTDADRRYGMDGTVGTNEANGQAGNEYKGMRERVLQSKPDKTILDIIGDALGGIILIPPKGK